MSMRKKPRLFVQRNTNGDFIAENLATPEGAQASEQLDRRLPMKLKIAALGGRQPSDHPLAHRALDT